MKLFKKTVLAASLCALLSAAPAPAQEEIQEETIYIAECTGFILQNSYDDEVNCTLKYYADKQPKLTCANIGGKGFHKVEPTDEGYKEVLDDLNFSDYKTKWIQDRPKLCKK